MEELAQKARGYEVELTETKSVMLQVKGEAKKLKEVAQEMQNENNKLVDKSWRIDESGGGAEEDGEGAGARLAREGNELQYSSNQ